MRKELAVRIDFREKPKMGKQPHHPSGFKEYIENEDERVLYLDRGGFHITIRDRWHLTEDAEEFEGFDLKELYKFFNSITEEYAKALCHDEAYMYFDIGISNKDKECCSWDVELADKYRNWYYFMLDDDRSEVILCKLLRPDYERKHIYVDYDFDDIRTIIFVKDLKCSTVKKLFERYISICTLQEKIWIATEKAKDAVIKKQITLKRIWK